MNWQTILKALTGYPAKLRSLLLAGQLRRFLLSGIAILLSCLLAIQAHAAISFVQQNYAVPQSPQATVSVVFSSSQTAGNLNVVVVGWSDSVAVVGSVTDSKGNVYIRAVGPTVRPGLSQSIYYAANIAGAAANTNTVTVQFSAPALYADIRILEYSGLATVSPVDVTAAATGTNATSSSGAATTTNANDLIFGANTVQTGTKSQGSGFTNRVITSPDGDIAEDRIVTTAGSYSAAAPLVVAGDWVMQMVAFKASGGVVDTTPPTAPANLAGTASGTGGVTLTWTASTDNIGVTSYLIERCQGIGCTSFVQVGTAPGVTYADTGLLPATSYTYRTRASDAAGNLSSYSNTSTATTAADTTPPTAPSNLAANASGISGIALSWTASTDNVGVTNYLVERCQGAGCTTFAQVGTSAGTTYVDSGLPAGTAYSYRTRATDAAGNLSSYSNTASATTNAPDTTPPTAPSSLAATASGGSGINLTWAGSTDNVGVTNYLVERCQGVGCTTFAQVGTSASTAFADTGLLAGTTYSYRTRATDAAGNFSGYSNTASATTVAPDTTPPTAPGNLVATAAGSGGINLIWSASTDNIGVTNYLIERCQGVGCSSWAQVGTSAGTTYADTGLLASTSYSYRTRATDAAGNLSTYSNAASATTAQGSSNPITFIQSNFATPQSAKVSVAVPFLNAQTAGNLNVVVVGWNDSTAQVSSVSDSKGNVYTRAVGPTVRPGQLSQSIYYAANIVGAAANATSVTVQFTVAAAYADIRILEYSGLATVNPVDVTAEATGTNAASNSGAVTTTSANELIFGANMVATGTTGPGSGFTNRVITSPDGDIAEDRIVTTAGSYSASAPLVSTGSWVMQMVAFSTVANAGPPQPTPDQVGAWSGPVALPLVTINMALLPTGRILAWDGPNETGNNAGVWDPLSNAFTAVGSSVNIFCTGQAGLADGRILVAGGHTGTHVGITAARIFDPVSQTWSTASSMTYPRWYPTVTTLPDGRALVVSGETSCDDCFAPIPEVYSPSTNSWTQLTTASLTIPYYPHMFVLSDGRVLNTSNAEAPGPTRVLDVQAGTWTTVDAKVIDGGSAVMYRPGKFLKTGTSVDPDTAVRPSAATAYVLDMTQGAPAWRQVSPMHYTRTYQNMVLLPDGNVLVVGGGASTDAIDLGGAVLNPELWSPATETFTRLTPMRTPRLYHSSALLLPDGRVVVAGGGRFNPDPDPSSQLSAEFYSPAYLFKGARPVIGSSPASIQYASNFSVGTADASRITSVVMMRLGAVTHAFDQNQSYVPLTFQQGAGSLTVQTPNSANQAPPGQYMLFIVDSNGVPSVASFVSIH